MGAFISILPNRLKAQQGWKLFEACCQWALLNVQIMTLLFTFTVQKYMHPPVTKVHAGSLHVSVIHQTLTWTTGSLMCVHGLSYACVYTWGLGTPTASRHNIFDSEKLTFFLCSWRDSNISPWDFEVQCSNTSAFLNTFIVLYEYIIHILLFYLINLSFSLVMCLLSDCIILLDFFLFFLFTLCCPNSPMGNLGQLQQLPTQLQIITKHMLGVFVFP